jgi:hypothetical protein
MTYTPVRLFDEFEYLVSLDLPIAAGDRPDVLLEIESPLDLAGTPPPCGFETTMLGAVLKPKCSNTYCVYAECTIEWKKTGLASESITPWCS